MFLLNWIRDRSRSRKSSEVSPLQVESPVHISMQLPPPLETKSIQDNAVLEESESLPQILREQMASRIRLVASVIVDGIAVYVWYEFSIFVGYVIDITKLASALDQSTLHFIQVSLTIGTYGFVGLMILEDLSTFLLQIITGLVVRWKRLQKIAKMRT